MGINNGRLGMSFNVSCVSCWNLRNSCTHLHPMKCFVVNVYIEMKHGLEMIYVILNGSTNMPVCKYDWYSKLLLLLVLFLSIAICGICAEKGMHIWFWRFISSKDGSPSINSKSQWCIFYWTMKMENKMIYWQDLSC